METRPCTFTERETKWDEIQKKRIGVTHTGFGSWIGWGLDFYEFETSAASYTVAVIEMGDGKVKMVRADDIQFTDKDAPAGK